MGAGLVSVWSGCDRSGALSRCSVPVCVMKVCVVVRLTNEAKLTDHRSLLRCRMNECLVLAVLFWSAFPAPPHTEAPGQQQGRHPAAPKTARPLHCHKAHHAVPYEAPGALCVHNQQHRPPDAPYRTLERAQGLGHLPFERQCSHRTRQTAHPRRRSNVCPHGEEDGDARAGGGRTGDSSG